MLKHFNILHDTITIKILGQDYKVKTGGNEEHIQSLSRYIDEKIRDVQLRGSAISATEVAAMVMLNMADDVTQARSELETLKKTISGKICELIDHIDTNMK